MRPGYELPFGSDNAMIKVMMKIYYDIRRTMVPPNVWGAFNVL
jgi:hypothetical protein